MPNMPLTDNYDRPKIKSQKTRKNAHRRGYTKKWVKARDRWLAKHPLCVECLKEGKVNNQHLQVDHIIPHRGNMALFWDQSNWQTLCRKHHSEKTRRGE